MATFSRRSPHIRQLSAEGRRLGVVSCIDYWQGAGKPIDIVSGRPISFTGTPGWSTPGSLPSQPGPTYRMTAGNAPYMPGGVERLNVGSREIVFAWVERRRNTTTGLEMVKGCDPNGIGFNGQYCVVFFPDILNRIAFYYGNLNSGDGALVVGYTQSTDWRSVVFVRAGPDGPGSRIYVDGVLVGANTGTALRDVNAGLPILMGSYIGSGTSGVDRDVAIDVIANRGWTAAEVMAFHRDPWRVLERPGVINRPPAKVTFRSSGYEEIRLDLSAGGMIAAAVSEAANRQPLVATMAARSQGLRAQMETNQGATAGMSGRQAAR